MRTVVLDTNVLLSDPDSLLTYPDAEVLIPETVLGEIDKLKTGRADADLRFRGREVSRMLFELSETGDMLAGVDLPGGGTLRIAPLNTDLPLPNTLNTRNADDRILAVALQACEGGCEDLTLVTNDLNMLLKAQALGLKVVHRENTADGSWAKRHIAVPFQRYRIPLTILAIAVAVFAAVIAFAVYSSSLVQQKPQYTTVPDEFRDMLSTDQRSLLDGLVTLQAKSSDSDALKQVANAYYNLHDQTSNIAYAQKAIDYFTRYLKIHPTDADARTDMAALYFYTGSTDRAIQEATTVLKNNPDHVQANFNLGIFYWRGRKDYRAAVSQFTKVEQLTAKGDANAQLVGTSAKTNIASIKSEAEKAGESIDATGGAI